MIPPCGTEGSIDVGDFGNASKDTGSTAHFDSDGHTHDLRPTRPASLVLIPTPHEHEHGGSLLALSIGESRLSDSYYPVDNISDRLVPRVVPYHIQLPTAARSWPGIL